MSAHTAPPLAESAGLSHAFTGASTLAFPDFVLARGEAIVLRGPSGAGKSTLLHLLAGVLAPRAPAGARLRVGETDLLRASARQRHALRPDRVGWVPQRPILQAGLTLLDNLLLPTLFSRGGSAEDARARADAWLRRLGLEPVGRRLGREASIGQAARVNLARALLLRPSLLLADEPTAALDAQSARPVAEAIAEHLAAGGGAVIATHDVAWAAELERAAPGAVRVLELPCG
jgi:putative ABC transport system ATP-binding protein